MAVLSAMPRLWSRNARSLDNTHFIFDNAYGDSYKGHILKAPRVLATRSLKRVYFPAAVMPYNSYQGINTVTSLIYDIDIPEAGTKNTSPLRTGDMGLNPGGMARNTAANKPDWSLTSSTTPAGTSPHRATGGMSDDGLTTVALHTRDTDAVLFMTIKQGATTVISLRNTGLTDYSSTKIVSHNFTNDTEYPSRVDPKVFVFSSTDVWIFHRPQNGDANPANGYLVLSVWNGTAFASPITIGSTPMLDNEIVRKDGKLFILYRTYTMGPSYLIVMDIATKAQTAPISMPWTAPNNNGQPYTNWRSGGRQPNNQVFTYKGYDYIVHSWYDQLVVWRWPEGNPSTITPFYREVLPMRASSPSTGVPYLPPLGAGCTTGITYDPESDTAHIVVCNMYHEHPSVVGAEADSSIVKVRLHTKPLDSATEPLSIMETAQPLDYVRAHGSLQHLFIEPFCYIPSRQGAAGYCLLMTHAMVSTQYTNSAAWINVFRLRMWHNAGDVFLEPEPVRMDVDTVSEMQADVSLTTGTTLALETHAELRRPRTMSWQAKWGGVQVSYVFLEANARLELDVLATLSTSSNVDLEAVGELEMDTIADMQVGITAVMEVYWPYMGVTFLEEFQGYMNADRAANFGRKALPVGGTTPKSLAIMQQLDISQMQSDNMAAARLQAHDSTEFPAGQQTFAERSRLMIPYDGVSGENVAVFTGQYTLGYPLPSAHAVYVNWRNSPGHYENMMFDWHGMAGAKYAADIFSLLAYTIGAPERDLVVSEALYRTIYLTNVFASLKESIVEAHFAFSWESHELQALLLEFGWDSYAVRKARAEHIAESSLRVAAEHVSLTSVQVSAEHVAVMLASVAVEHSAIYTHSQTGFGALHIGDYDIEPPKVSAEHQLWWSRSVAQEHRAEWGDYPKVRAEHMALYGQPIPVGRTHTALFAIQRQVQALHEARVSLSGRVLASMEHEYSLLTGNPVTAGFQALYALPDASAPAFEEPRFVVTLDGMTLEVDDGYISSSIDAAGYTASFVVDDIAFAARANQLQEIEIDFRGTKYRMFISNIQSRIGDDEAATQDTITALSPVFLLSDEFCTSMTYAPETARMFSEVLEDVLGQSVDFSRHIDWLIPFGRAQASDQSPLQIAMGFLASVGSCLQSNPDGSLYVLPRYRFGMDTLEGRPVDVAASDEDNIFTRSSGHEHAHGFNRYRVRDSDAQFGDIIEFDKDESIVSVYVSPYRQSWELRCTADVVSGILLDALGEEVQEHEKLVEFQAGAAQVDYPILEVVSLEWLTQALTGVSFTPFSTRLAAPTQVNFGYALAKIKYRSRVSKYRLSASSPVEATQLIIVEK